MLIVGDKEVENATVSVRDRKEGDIGSIKTEDFIKRIVKEVEEYK